MQWKIQIDNKPNQRIIVVFKPLNQEVEFHGQYKPHNKEWTDFANINASMDIELDGIKAYMENTISIMNERVKAYENLNEGFNIIKNIEVGDIE